MIALPHLAARLYGTPLLMTRAKLDVILAVLGPRIGIDHPAPTWEATRSPSRLPRGVPTNIAIISIHGTLIRRSLALAPASGLTAYDDLRAELEVALDDPRVAGIFLDLDSPGGEAGGVFELAEWIRTASARKPIWAHASEAAFSAAYALGAAAQRLTLSRTAGVGSIGVIALHVDQSVRDAQDGVTYTAITAGARKNDFSPHEPLAPEAAAQLQAEVDRLYALFVAHIAEMRRLDPVSVRGTEAGLFFGEHAVALGLADDVCSTDVALVSFAQYLTGISTLGPTARLEPPRSPFALHLESPMQPQESPVIPSEMDAPTLESSPPPAAPPRQPEPVEPEGELDTDPVPPMETNTSEFIVLQARAEMAREAQAIAELCLLAGCASLTAEYLAAGMTQADVRRALLARRADQAEIHSTVTMETESADLLTRTPEKSPVVAAVRKLNAYAHRPEA